MPHVSYKIDSVVWFWTLFVCFKCLLYKNKINSN